MGRPAIALLACLAALGSWLLWGQPSVLDVPAQGGGAQRKLASGKLRETSTWTRSGTRALRERGTIRVATLDLANSAEPQISAARMQFLAACFSQFDVVVVQNLASPGRHIASGWCDALGDLGRRYEMMISVESGRHSPKRCSACLFDSSRIQADRSNCYAVQDPDDLFAHEPFVFNLRCRGVDPRESFTFSLVSVFLDLAREEAERESALLWTVLQSVQRDGRGEDDVLIAGNFQGLLQQPQLGRLHPDAILAVSPETLPGVADKILSNILLSQQATVEFTGRAGVFDLLREYNLSLEQRGQLGCSSPVWVEFSIREGGE